MCNGNWLLQTSLSGERDVSVVDPFQTPDICCFSILDPHTYSDFLNLDEPLPELSGTEQTYQCDVFPRNYNGGGFSAKIGRDSCCAVNGFTAPFEFLVENDSDVCANESNLCQTQIILVVSYDNDIEHEIRLYNDSSDMHLFNFTLLKVHYQVCGDDVLHFILPISSSHPLNVTCSEVSPIRPSRRVDDECTDLYSAPTTEPERATEFAETTASNEELFSSNDNDDQNSG